MLGKRLRLLRGEKGLSQIELSKGLSIANSTLSLYESDSRQPDYETLFKIADYFEVTIDYLLGRSDQRNPEIIDLAAHRKDGDYNKPLSEETHKKIHEFVQFVDRTFGIKASGAEQNEKINRDSRETRD